MHGALRILPRMSIYVPALVLGIYTLLFYIYLGLSRNKAIKARDVDYRYYGMFSGGEEPKWLQVRSRHAANLLEMPMLFYVVVLMIHTSGATSPLFLGLAWAFVGSRFVHAVIHLTINQVVYRFIAFAIGVVILLAMWALLLVRLL